MRSRTALFWLLALLQLWFAHAIGYMAHEYAHSFTAWLLHAKTNPLALDYGGWNVTNLLLQSDIDENVDYAPLFAVGRDTSAALIAVAGVLFGNGISYLASRLLFRKARQRANRAWAMFFFWLCLMSVGNFLSYVPIRTFATHADMATTALGLHVSAWAIALVLGLPFAVAIWHFFAKILPEAEEILFPVSLLSRRILVLIAAYLVFFFYGSAGIRNYGGVSHGLSVVSEFVFFPIAAVFCWPRDQRVAK